MEPFAYIRRSYDQLRDTDAGYLARALREVGGIRSDSRRWEILMRELRFDRARFGERECVLRGLSWVAPLKLTAQQIVYGDDEPRSIQDVREQEMYSGEAPLATDAGTLLIDGAHRVVRGELGACVGFAPFERGWRFANIWGDCLEFVALDGGVEIHCRLADDSVSALWTGEPPTFEPKGKKSALREPAVPENVIVRTREDIQNFLGRYPLPTTSRAVIAPSSLFAGAEEDPWSSEDFERVLDWVRTEEADKLRRAQPVPLRVLGPGLIVARWVRRGLFLTAMDALDRGDTMSFGTRAKPRRKQDFSWLPHDTWNCAPLASLLRARLTSEATAPTAPIASPVSTASLQRTLRLAANVRAPSEWLSSSVKKVTLLELPMCELDRDGEVLRPDRFTDRTIRGALGLTQRDREVDPLAIASPDALPTDAALSSECARATLASRRFEQTTNVLARTDDALAVTDAAGARWIERSPACAQQDRLFREQWAATDLGAHERGARYAESASTRDGALAIGKLLRIGFDLRVTPGAAWVTTARIGDAMDAMRGRQVESVLHDTRYGREAWRGALTTDSLADVGAVLADGATLATVLEPTDNAALSPEDRLLRAIDGEPMGAMVERPARWPGPTATVIAREVFARRGVDELVPLVRAREARLEALRARVEACAAIDDELARAALLEQVEEDRDVAQRGNDLPPGVIAVATWLLAWRAPLAIGSVLSLRNDRQLTVEKVESERFFDGTTELDVLAHPSMREAIIAAAARADDSADASSSAALCCYVLREG